MNVAGVAEIAVGCERPVILHLGDGALGFSSMGLWTMARYNSAMLIGVSNNESYQIVRHNWANDMPDSKMMRDGKYRASRSACRWSTASGSQAPTAWRARPSPR